MTNIPTWHERAEAHPDGGQAMTDKIEEIRDRVEQDVAKGPANKELYRVHKDRAFLLAEVDRLRRHVDALQEKVSAESCACSYDSPDAVCLAHSPQLSAALADVDRLTRQRDEARAEVENLYDQVHRWVDDRAKAQARADRLCEQNYELQRERDEARAEVERLHKALHKIAGKVPFADDPWTIARKALEAKP